MHRLKTSSNDRFLVIFDLFFLRLYIKLKVNNKIIRQTVCLFVPIPEQSTRARKKGIKRNVLSWIRSNISRCFKIKTMNELQLNTNVWNVWIFESIVFGWTNWSQFDFVFIQPKSFSHGIYTFLKCDCEVQYTGIHPSNRTTYLSWCCVCVCDFINWQQGIEWMSVSIEK